MKIAAGWFRDGRGLALGFLIGALTLGKAFPHLLAALFGTQWRAPMLLASVLAIVGGTLVLLVVRDGPHVTATTPFDPHAIRKILSSRGARLAIFGYLGHMWELYAMWTWVVVFAWTSLTDSGVADVAAAGSMAAFLAIGSGAVGLRAGGLCRGSSRQGARRDVGHDRAAPPVPLSPLVVYGGAPMLLYVLIMVWGFAVVADSAQFSALVSEHAPRDHVGTALTLQTCVGFLLTMVTIELLPRVADYTGWRWASLLARYLGRCWARGRCGGCRPRTIE